MITFQHHFRVRYTGNSDLSTQPAISEHRTRDVSKLSVVDKRSIEEKRCATFSFLSLSLTLTAVNFNHSHRNMADASVELTSKQKRRAKKRAQVKAGSTAKLPLTGDATSGSSGAIQGKVQSSLLPSTKSPILPKI